MSHLSRTTTPRAPVAQVGVSPFYFHGDVGLGTPEGLAGAGLGVAPTSWSSIEIGAGLADSGWQAASMLGLHVPVSDDATLGVSSGVSIGRQAYSQGILGEHDFQEVWDWALWSNTEMTVRRSFGPEMALRLHAGVAALLAFGKPSCNGTCPGPGLDKLVPYFGFGFERHF
jgi:hypothetical protein